jgi:hypothetical protein
LFSMERRNNATASSSAPRDILAMPLKCNQSQTKLSRGESSASRLLGSSATARSKKTRRTGPSIVRRIPALSPRAHEPVRKTL